MTFRLAAGLSLAVSMLGAAAGSPAPFAQTAAEVDAYLASGERADLVAAMALIAEVEPNATEALERARLAAASVRVARAACRHHLAQELEASFSSAQRLLAPQPVIDTADPALLALAESAVWMMAPADAERWLLRIEPLVWSPARRVELATSWWALHDRAGDAGLRRRCADQAIRLDPASVRAQAELAASDDRRGGAVLLVGFLLALAGVIAALRFLARRRREAKTRAVAALGPLERELAPSGGAVVTWAAGGLLLVVAGAMVFAGAMQRGWDALLSGPAWSLGMVLFGLWAFHQSTLALGLHRSGVAGYSILGARMLRYEEMTRFRYLIQARYRMGIYQGTRHRVRFSSGAGGHVAYGHNEMSHQNLHLESVRDRASRVIAQRMLERLRSGQEVPWGGRAWLGPEGVRAGGRTVPYGAGLNGRIERGKFRLYGARDQGLVAVIDCDDDNFHAGLRVLGAMADGRAAAA